MVREKIFYKYKNKIKNQKINYSSKFGLTGKKMSDECMMVGKTTK